MLFTLLAIGSARYVLDAATIVEILPQVGITPAAGTAPHVLGVLNYHGSAVPVVDLNRLAGCAPPARALSTRLLIVAHQGRRLALLAAAVTETLHLDPERFVADDPELQRAAWQGPVATRGAEFLRRMEVAPLFGALGAVA